jgi:hypothetical protein
MRWVPLSARGDSEKSDAYAALHEGIPPWMRASAIRWVSSVLGGSTNELLRLEQHLHFPINWSSSKGAMGSVLGEFNENGERALDILDYCLTVAARSPSAWELREALTVMLAVSGSAWTVGEDAAGRPCLHRRVDETVEQAARDEMAEKGNAARHLHLAWHRVYGRNADPSGAYREAVRAVEAAAKPVVTPNDPMTTLGKMIRAMRDKPSKWVSDLGSVSVVADMMSELWTTQLDRHGTDDESVPLSVSPGQAEAAVHLALTLVHWFRSGRIRLI